MVIGIFNYSLISLNKAGFKPLLNPIVLLSKPTQKSYETLSRYFHFSIPAYRGRKIGSRML